MAAPLQITLDGLSALATRRAAEIERLNFRQPLEVSKLLIIGATRQNFARGQTPEGVTWRPLKRPRRRSKGRDLPLRDTGILMASATGGARRVERITNTELVTGTNVEYAGFHQVGTRHIPARPFLGFTPQLVKDIDRAFTEFVEKQLGF